MVKKLSKNILVKIALLAFAIYVVAMLVHLQMRISETRSALLSVTAQVEEQQATNAELQRLLSEDNVQYQESVARDKLGYAMPDERIFINVTGN